MHGVSSHETPSTSARRVPTRGGSIAPERLPGRASRMRSLESPPALTMSSGLELRPVAAPLHRSEQGAWAPAQIESGMGFATALPALPMTTYTHPFAAPAQDPTVWLIALPTSGGGHKPLEGAGRSGAIRVARPYGHLRSVHPVGLDSVYGVGPAESTAKAPKPRRSRSTNATTTGSLGSAEAGDSRLPAPRPAPALVAAVEVESDAGIFRVERRGGMLTHADIAWAMANMEAGEPDSVVPLPRRQLALLLTLLPTPEDPEHPELDPNWGWAHRLRGPWERGPLHHRGRLGRLIAFDADETTRGMHRACFELLGSDEVVWAVGVPCFRTGSVYELVPLGKGLSPSRWLNWPLAKGRRGSKAPERPHWEIARVVYRVGAPRWPLAGVVEPLGPMGVAG